MVKSPRRRPLHNAIRARTVNPCYFMGLDGEADRALRIAKSARDRWKASRRRHRLSTDGRRASLGAGRE
jgi:hypothetical protein